MKKFAAIFYLSLLLFTTAGYRMLVNFLEHRAQHNLQAVIEEKSFDPAHLIDLSVDLELPYLGNWQNWEAIEGIVTIEGTPYQYVERILKDGKMHYHCLPNNGMEQVFSARDRFMQLSYDFTHQGTQKQPASASISIKPPVMDLFCNEGFSIDHLLAEEPFSRFGEDIFGLPVPVSLSVPTPPPNAA